MADDSIFMRSAAFHQICPLCSNKPVGKYQVSDWWVAIEYYAALDRFRRGSEELK